MDYQAAWAADPDTRFHGGTDNGNLQAPTAFSHLMGAYLRPAPTLVPFRGRAPSHVVTGARTGEVDVAKPRSGYERHDGDGPAILPARIAP